VLTFTIFLSLTISCRHQVVPGAGMAYNKSKLFVLAVIVIKSIL